MMTSRRRFITGLSARAGLAAASQSYYLLEFSEPRAGRESHFDRQWRSHLAAMLALPGFLSATPLRRADLQLSRPSAVPLPSRLSLFTLESADFPALYRRIEQGLRRGRIAALSAAEPTASRTMVYRKAASWSNAHAPSAGDVYRQLVMTDARPGEDEAYRRWYDGTHARQLLGVPGVYEVARGERVMAATQSEGPRYLSLMGIKTTSLDQFSTAMDQSSRTTIGSDTYDSAHAWRGLYRQDEWGRERERRKRP